MQQHVLFSYYSEYKLYLPLITETAGATRSLQGVVPLKDFSQLKLSKAENRSSNFGRVMYLLALSLMAPGAQIRALTMEKRAKKANMTILVNMLEW